MTKPYDRLASLLAGCTLSKSGDQVRLSCNTPEEAMALFECLERFVAMSEDHISGDLNAMGDLHGNKYPPST